MNNLDKQHAIEEAAALSLDQPNTEPSAKQVELRQQTHETASLGYHQVSLASLTLHQRADHSAASTAHSKRDVRNHQDNSTSDPQLWTEELRLTRIKPSWLNVSSKFKISGATVEELQSRLPAEYLLRPAFDSPILLKTKLGIVEGVRSIKFNKNLYTFLSVPYARPPVGELRFKAPEPVERWDGILQATKWPPFCVQPSATLASRSSPVHLLTSIMTEDCLYANIWTPSLKFQKSRKRPVMVWIHGGAFQYGGISVDENDASALALLGDVVVVTFSYRVSAFGFLNANNPKSGPNNVGILDQRAALEWVQQNIKQFGGDPQQVTLFGESAGGHSVGLHMISPKSQQLFKRAILQSGVPISLLRSYDVNSDNTQGPAMGEGVGSVMMAKRLKCYADESALAADSATEVATTVSSSSSSSNSSSTVTTTTDSENQTSPRSDEMNSTTADQEAEDEPVLNDQTLECMRNKSSLEILKAMGAPGNAGFFPTGNDLKGFFPNGPIMESFEAENPQIGPQKDYMIGTNTDEGTFMLHYAIPSEFPSKAPPKVADMEELKAALTAEIERIAKNSQFTHKNNGDSNSATNETTISDLSHQNGGAQAHLYKPLLRTSTNLLETFMSKSRPSQARSGLDGTNNSTSGEAPVDKYFEFGRALGSMLTDIIFLCPARSLARTLSANGRNVYFYLYNHRSSLSAYHPWIGVTHHDEVEFVFGRPLRLADVYSGKDIEMSQRMIKIWSHFAYTGKVLDQLGVNWPLYGEEDNNYLVLDSDSASIGQRYHDKVCNIYDTVISVHLRDT